MLVSESRAAALAPEARRRRAEGAPKARVAFRRAPRTPPEITREKFAKNVALPIFRPEKKRVSQNADFPPFAPSSKVI